MEFMMENNENGVKTNKLVEFLKEKTKNIKWKEVLDKVTTGLLIVLLASPILILAYIFLWFVYK